MDKQQTVSQMLDNDKFKQYSRDIEVDWETVKAKIRADKDREAAANQ